MSSVRSIFLHVYFTLVCQHIDCICTSHELSTLVCYEMVNIELFNLRHCEAITHIGDVRLTSAAWPIHGVNVNVLCTRHIGSTYMVDTWLAYVLRMSGRHMYVTM